MNYCNLYKGAIRFPIGLNAFVKEKSIEHALIILSGKKMIHPRIISCTWLSFIKSEILEQWSALKKTVCAMKPSLGGPEEGWDRPETKQGALTENKDPFSLSYPGLQSGSCRPLLDKLTPDLFWSTLSPLPYLPSSLRDIHMCKRQSGSYLDGAPWHVSQSVRSQ